MALADVVVEEQEPSSSILDSRHGADSTVTYASLHTRAEALIQRARDSLASQGFAQNQVTTELSYNCRFQGTSAALMVREPEDGDFVGNFVKQHDQLFGFTLQDRVIFVDDIRVRAVAKSTRTEQQSPYEELESCTLKEATGVLGNCKRTKVYFDGLGWTDTAVVPLEDLSSGDQIPVSVQRSLRFQLSHLLQAPAIIFDNTQTILIEPGYIATATSKHIIIDRTGPSLAKPALDYNHVDPIQLSVFGHRFMGIAEQVCVPLQMMHLKPLTHYYRWVLFSGKPPFRPISKNVSTSEFYQSPLSSTSL